MQPRQALAEASSVAPSIQPALPFYASTCHY